MDADDKGTLNRGVVAFMIVSLKKSVPFIIKAFIIKAFGSNIRFY